MSDEKYLQRLDTIQYKTGEERDVYRSLLRNTYKGPGWYAEINEPYRMPEKGLICVNSVDELVTLSNNR